MNVKIECNVCGGTEFADQGTRRDVRCLQCASFERTRMLWMHLDALDLDHTTRVLHMAPERGIWERLSSRLDPERYVTADFDPVPYRRFAPDCRHIDLCDLDGWESCAFDLIIHSHVLEHTPCSIAYTIYHLHRMLVPGGRHLMVVPFLAGGYDETFGDLEEAERIRRFGQDDHVRRFGRADVGRHLGAVLRLPTFDAEARFGAERLARANIPSAEWQGLTSSTVFSLMREDYALGSLPPSDRAGEAASYA